MTDETKPDNKMVQMQSQLTKLYVHDFKNPISALTANMSYLEAMLEDVDQDVKEAVSDSEVALKMLLHMIDNYLNIARLEAGDKIEPAVVNINNFVLDACTKCKSLFTVPEPILELDENLPTDMCYWPIAYAKLAVENFVLSSLYNTPSKGKVTLTVHVEDSNAVFVVEDNGVVIKPEYFNESFDKDFQIIAKSDDHARYGRALAMYAVKSAATYMGGSVSVLKSDKDISRFELRLPLETAL